MNQATNVNIVPSYGQRGDLHFSQYDVGRTATINLYAVNEAYTIPVGATVKIQATKPSGLGFDVACTFSGSVVTVVSTETMTEEAGRFPCELRITKDSDVIGTANFMFVVEPSPHPDGTIDGDAEEVVNEIKALVLQSEGYALGTQDGVPVDNTSPYYHNNAKWLSDNAVLSDEVKQTLLACFEKVAWIDGNGQTYYDALQTALNRGAELLSISAVYTQSGTVYDTDSLDDLKSDLVVTATYDGGETETVLTYTLSGSLTVGTSTITVSYGGKTTTFSVTVTHYVPSQGDIFGTFTNGYSLGKAQNGAQGDIPRYGVWNNSTNYRAAMTTPIANNNYVLTVTDSTKYNICVYDITDNTPVSTTYASAVLGVYYQGGAKSVSWATSGSASTSYIMVSLKKNNNTAFTDEELANGAEAVFTYTSS